MTMVGYKQAIKQLTRRDRVFDFMVEDQRPAIDVSHQVLLYLEGITVSFDGFKALDNLNLYINDGELRCLIGANGAGKTTLMDVITGKTKVDQGLAYFGRDINLLTMAEADIANLGIARKFQKPTVFEFHTVFENLELALRCDKFIFETLFFRLNGEQQDRIDEVLAIIGLLDFKYQSASVLSHGQKQWLEIGMLLIADPRLLLVDEPVAGMTGQETERTAELLTSLAGERTVLVVEHDMAFVRSLNTRVTVMHQGALLAEGFMHEVQSNQAVIDVYLGESD